MPNEGTAVKSGTTSPVKVPRLLMNIASDLKEVASGPRVRAPPKFYGRVSRLSKLNAWKAKANDERATLRMKTVREETLRSNFTLGERYQRPCKACSAMSTRTANALVEEAMQMDGETTAEWDKRLAVMEDRLAQQATDESMPSDGDEEAILYANVAVHLAANRISVKAALGDKDADRSKKASDAVDLEINGLIAMGFGVPTYYNKMTSEEKQSIIQAFMFKTERNSASEPLTSGRRG